MLTTLASYLSHTQIWALQSGTDLHVAGTTNRAKLVFTREFQDILDLVPDRAMLSSIQDINQRASELDSPHVSLYEDGALRDT